MFREVYPRELMNQLKKQGAVVEEKFSGIYYVTGCMFDTQIVVTGQLRVVLCQDLVQVKMRSSAS
jgi:hypothetical protein